MATIKVLDLFCGAGGVTKGWQLAGCHVTGVDNKPQPNYCGDAFIQADALCYVEQYGRRFDVIVASPPCQRYSKLNWPSRKQNHPDLLPPVRERLVTSGRPYVIENVEGAPMVHPVRLCGLMFGLRTYRHRLFESNLALSQPPHPSHVLRVGFGPHDMVTVAGHGGDGPNRKHAWAEALQIDWMTKDELRQAIPPAYSLFIARQVLWAMGVRPLEAAVTYQPSLFAVTEVA